jgi:membrane-associated phospholipid phosphatase
LDLEGIRSGPLNVFFFIITDLGSNLGYLVVLSLVYWCVDKRSGRGLAYSSLLSATLNIWLKHIWNIPRPDDVALEGVLQKAGIKERVTPLREATLPSFPSGHAQGAAVTWGYIASLVRARAGSTRKRWVGYALAGLVVLIAFSRIYLGVHFPQDVIAGLGIGAAYLAVWVWAESRVAFWLATISVNWRYALAVLAPLVLLLVQPGEDTSAAMGAVMGLGVGYVLEGQTVRFDTAGTWQHKVLRGALGLGLTIATYFGLRVLFGLVPAEGNLKLAWRTLRYALVGFVGGWGVPWAFVRVGWAQQVD